MCKARGPKEQDSLTHVDNCMMDGDRKEHRPTGPKGESGLNRLLPESRAEVGLGQSHVAETQALENSYAAMSTERAHKLKPQCIAAGQGVYSAVQLTSSNLLRVSDGPALE